MLLSGFQRIAFVFFGLGCVSASVQEIGPGLYAYISTNDSSSNATFAVGDQGILVVDTGLNAEEGRKLLAEIRKVSSLPVRWIVNTHYHPDHRGGNSTVGPDAIIIGTAFTRERSLRDKASAGGALNVTVGKQGLSLYVGGHEVRIYHPGPAHTRGDLVVYFPDARTLATGDLFLNQSCPAMDDGDLENWVAALDRMLSLPVEHVVPGHFGLASTGQMRHFRNYLSDLRDQVSRMHGEGLPLAQVRQRLDLADYKDLRQFPQYEATFSDNAGAYYRQLEARKRSLRRRL